MVHPAGLSEDLPDVFSMPVNGIIRFVVIIADVWKIS